MELKLYWHIIRKRLWLVLGLIALVALSYWVFRPPTIQTYTAHMRFVVGLKPEPNTGNYYTYDRYYTWLTAEYLVDDLAEIVKSRAFANDVAALAGIDIPPGAIQAATSAGKLHRILNVSITWSNAQELAHIANACVETFLKRGDAYFAQLGTDSGVFSLIDPPNIVPNAPSLRQRLDLPLRLILALVAGLGLAFLLDYLDDTVRHRADLEELNLSILAEIPRERKNLLGFLQRRQSP